MAVTLLQDRLGDMVNERGRVAHLWSAAIKRRDRSESQLPGGEAVLVKARAVFKQASRRVTAEQTGEKRRHGSLEKVELSLENMMDASINLKRSTTNVKELREKVLKRRAAAYQLASSFEQLGDEAKEMEDLVHNAKEALMSLGCC